MGNSIDWSWSILETCSKASKIVDTHKFKAVGLSGMWLSSFDIAFLKSGRWIRLMFVVCTCIKVGAKLDVSS